MRTNATTCDSLLRIYNAGREARNGFESLFSSLDSKSSVRKNVPVQVRALVLFSSSGQPAMPPAKRLADAAPAGEDGGCVTRELPDHGKSVLCPPPGEGHRASCWYQVKARSCCRYRTSHRPGLRLARRALAFCCGRTTTQQSAAN